MIIVHSEEYQCIIEGSYGANVMVRYHQTAYFKDAKEEKQSHARMSLLYKKKDKRDPANWGALCIFNTIVNQEAALTDARLGDTLEALNPLEQCGFMRGRSTTDGIFSVVQIIELRRELGLETYAAMIDLIKCFDRIQHEMVYRVMGIFGFNTHVIRQAALQLENLVLALKTRDRSEDDILILANTGLFQGLKLCPKAFLLVWQAITLTLEWPEDCSTPMVRVGGGGAPFCERNILRAHSRQHGATRLRAGKSCFADGAAFFWATWVAIQKGLAYLRVHLARFGCEAHCAIGTTPAIESKTSAVHFTPGNTQQPLPQTLILESFSIGTRKFETGRVPFVIDFKYLGAHLSSLMDEDRHTELRVKGAWKAWHFP